MCEAREGWDGRGISPHRRQRDRLGVAAGGGTDNDRGTPPHPRWDSNSKRTTARGAAGFAPTFREMSAGWARLDGGAEKYCK